MAKDYSTRSPSGIPIRCALKAFVTVALQACKHLAVGATTVRPRLLSIVADNAVLCAVLWSTQAVKHVAAVLWSTQVVKQACMPLLQQEGKTAASCSGGFGISHHDTAR